ncbi:MAG: hypothetical protein EBR82_17945 [Caulobacteraceae bacterium]|nr:hypothetical protein [Caulobacteraceae bacterium]
MKLQPGPDAARYLLAAQGKPVARPFNVRWLLPAVCKDDPKRWTATWFASWPLLAAGSVVWALGMGADWQAAVAAAAFLVALPGVWGPHSVRPVGVDLPSMAVAIWAAAAFAHGQPLVGVVIACIAAGISEKAPVMVALWAWTPWALVALVVPLVANFVRRPGLDEVTAVPLLKRVHDHPITTAMEHRRQQGGWRNAWLMVAPWGVTLAALLDPSPWLIAAMVVAYAQLLVATDVVRLYQAVAGPVACLAAAGVIPTQWLLLAVVVHVVWWRPPVTA